MSCRRRAFQQQRRLRTDTTTLSDTQCRTVEAFLYEGINKQSNKVTANPLQRGVRADVSCPALPGWLVVLVGSLLGLVVGWAAWLFAGTMHGQPLPRRCEGHTVLRSAVVAVVGQPTPPAKGIISLRSLHPNPLFFTVATVARLEGPLLTHQPYACLVAVLRPILPVAGRTGGLTTKPNNTHKLSVGFVRQPARRVPPVDRRPTGEKT